MKAKLAHVLAANYTSVKDIAESMGLRIDGTRVVSAETYTLDIFKHALAVYIAWEIQSGTSLSEKQIIDNLGSYSARQDILDILPDPNECTEGLRVCIDPEKLDDFLKTCGVNLTISDIAGKLGMSIEDNTVFLTKPVSVSEFENTLDEYISEALEFGENVNYTLSCLQSRHDEAQCLFKEMLYEESK